MKDALLEHLANISIRSSYSGASAADVYKVFESGWDVPGEEA